MIFIKKFFGVSSLMLLATVVACGSGRNKNPNPNGNGNGNGNGYGVSPVAITSPSTLPSGVVGTPYSASLAATGGTTPYSWAITGCSGACNTGLGFSSAGVLSGTPANVGTSTFVFGVTDANGRTSSASLSVTIGPAASTAPTTPPTTPPTTAPVSITSSTLPSGTVSTSYNTALAASGGTTPYTWSIKGCSGVCDPNLTLSQAGVLSGTPAKSGTSTYSVGVSDATGQAASASLGLTIAPSSTPSVTPLAVTSSTLPSGTVSTSYNTALAASGGTTPYTWSIKGCSGVCDPNLTLSQAGVLSGTPASSGTSTYSVGVSDATGQTASVSLGLTIAAAPSSGTIANYYVSPSGSDSNPCTQTSPCATPDYVFNNKAVAGDTIQVAAGTYSYSSNVKLTNSGAPGKYITLACVTRGACTIVTTNASSSGTEPIIWVQGSYLTIDGFEITNNNPTIPNVDIGLYMDNPASHRTITHNIVHHIESSCSDNGGGGISASNHSGNGDIWDSNIVYDIGWLNPSACDGKNQVSAIQFEANSPAVGVITNNIVYQSRGGWCMQDTASAVGTTGTTISNNLMFNCGNGGIIFALNGGSGTMDYNTVTNNIFLDNGFAKANCGFFEYNDGPYGTHNVYQNNDMFGNAGGDYCFNNGSQTGGISVDPSLGTTFVNWKADGSGDYHQKAGSPTINNGMSSTGAPPKDFDGNPRPQGAAYDIGAYESPY